VVAPFSRLACDVVAPFVYTVSRTTRSRYAQAVCQWVVVVVVVVLSSVGALLSFQQPSQQLSQQTDRQTIWSSAQPGRRTLLCGRAAQLPPDILRFDGERRKD
jgi:hypothetical protein